MPAARITAALEPSRIRRDASKLSDRVAIELGTKIVRGEFDAGARLPTETELCSLLGVSRSVIRDAIRTLAARGLVEVRQGHGMQVTTPTDTPFAEALMLLLMRSSLSVGDVQDARVAIEMELVPLAAKMGCTSDWDRMDRSLANYLHAVTERDWRTAQDAHLEFHFSVLEATRMPALKLILQPMQEIISLTSVPPDYIHGDPETVWTADDVALHRPIVIALREGDEQGARGAMETHFLRSASIASDHAMAIRALPFRDTETAQEVLRNILKG